MGKDKENMEKVTFESFNVFWQRERSGIKNNTVKHWKRFDKRFKLLDDFKDGFINELYIEMINKETKESFVRKIRDVTLYSADEKLIYGITWDNKEAV